MTTEKMKSLRRDLFKTDPRFQYVVRIPDSDLEIAKEWLKENCPNLQTEETLSWYTPAVEDWNLPGHEPDLEYILAREYDDLDYIVSWDLSGYLFAFKDQNTSILFKLSYN